MAVYTKLTFNQISNFIDNYNIGQLKKFDEIVAGIDNSNFIIHTTQDKFILTIFEARIKEQDIPYFINLKAHLSTNNISCPKPLIAKNNQTINKINNKNAVIVTFLKGRTLAPRKDGYYDNINTKHCAQIGQVTAKMHLAANNFTLNRHNDLDRQGLIDLIAKIDDNLDIFEPNLSVKIIENLQFIKNNWQNDLPHGAIHADLFPDNVFFNDDNNLAGVIDFYFAANDLFIYDLAIVINAWCFDCNNQFNQQKFISLINSYSQIRPLSKEEGKFLPIALRCASMRFLITRIYDYFNTPKDSIVNVKDPKEYVQKLNYFINNGANLIN